MTRDELDLVVARIEPTDFNSTTIMANSMVDYINTLEQRIDELEAQAKWLEAERSNMQRTHQNNKSGYVGVQFHKGTGKWQAQIAVNGKNKYIGLFSTAEDAAIAYNSTRLFLYGDNQKINEVQVDE